MERGVKVAISTDAICFVADFDEEFLHPTKILLISTSSIIHMTPLFGAPEGRGGGEELKELLEQSRITFSQEDFCM